MKGSPDDEQSALEQEGDCEELDGSDDYSDHEDDLALRLARLGVQVHG